MKGTHLGADVGVPDAAHAGGRLECGCSAAQTLGAMATCEGVVLTKMRASIYARYANTTLMEATAVTELVRGVRKELNRQGKVNVQLWPFCDNKGAAETSNQRDLIDKPQKMGSRVKAHEEVPWAAKPFRVGCCPAEHDTHVRSVVSELQKVSDAEAQRAARGEESTEWHVPPSWMDEKTAICKEDGYIVASVKKALQRKYHWHDGR